MRNSPPDSALSRAIRPLTAAHPRKSGLIVLDDGGDALAARIQLADAAERTIDAQYYIWHHDNAGTLLLQALLRAADRGVHVRLLLDDNNTDGLDDALAAFNTHPNIDVRVFNPFPLRSVRWLGLIADFARLNRRMHNKSFTVDGVATIVGGRNIGDEYFGTGDGVEFIDLDVLAVGPVVGAVTEDFNRYWHSQPARPLNRVLGLVDADPDRYADRIPGAHAAMPESAVPKTPCINDLLCGCATFEWARAELISDDPNKVMGRARRHGLVWPKLREIIGLPKHELRVVSPYFVPMSDGVAYLTMLARRGVKVSVLTNSLEATDVAAVHAGYARRRTALLRAGVALFELRRQITLPRTRRRKRIVRASASLHAKTFIIDGERVFIGSFNFDPRSRRLNTEMGLMIESEAIARACADRFGNDGPEHAYRVALDDAGALRWHMQDAQGASTLGDEPGATWARRTLVRALSCLPIDHLL